MSDRAQNASPIGVTITGSGIALPRCKLTNADLEKTVETSDEWIVQRTGIRQRYVSRGGETVCSLSVQAMRGALAEANLSPSDLDLLIVATMTEDMICPATACQVVAELGAAPCGAMDINLACTGFVAGLNIAANFVRSGMYRHVAVVGSEQLSRIVNWQDRATCILFGDGAGAAICSVTDDPRQGCLFQRMYSDGRKWAELYVPRTKSHVPDGGVFNDKLDTLQMNGREVYKFAVTTFGTAIHEAMDALDLKPDDVKMIIPHQSNIRILESARDKLGFGKDKVYINIDRYGNTSAASVGICLHELRQAGRLKTGDVVIFAGFGGGLTWATSVWRL